MLNALLNAAIMCTLNAASAERAGLLGPLAVGFLRGVLADSGAAAYSLPILLLAGSSGVAGLLAFFFFGCALVIALPRSVGTLHWTGCRYVEHFQQSSPHCH